MPRPVRELLALMALAALGIGFSWAQGDQLFAAIFAAQGLVAVIGVQRWLRSPP
jgi:hypothetical protein